MGLVNPKFKTRHTNDTRDGFDQGFWWVQCGLVVSTHTLRETQAKGAARVRRRVHLLTPPDDLFHRRILPLGYADLTDYLHAKIRDDAALIAGHVATKHG